MWTIITGFICFLAVQFFGLIIVNFINIDISYATQSHFFLAFLGWLGIVVMGAQLQFYRAITGLRKFEPEILRWLFLGCLISGLILLVYGTSYENRSILILGLILYSCGVVIHLYWTIRRVNSKYFKFPLDYFLASQVYFVSGLILLFYKLFRSEIFIREMIEIRHVFLLGWISLTLQGALIRIMPMFLGKNIDRPSKRFLPIHFWFSTISSGLFIISFFSGNLNLIRPTSLFWLISWIWAIIILVKSVKFTDLQYKQTLLFLLPGLIYLSLGALLGFYLVESTDPIERGIRNVHIHLSLVAGLSMIMMGAMHRINAFQIYTILYTGKRESGVGLKDFLYLKYMVFIAILLNISTLFLVYGFYKMKTDLIRDGGIMMLFGTLLYAGMIGSNMIKYLKYKKGAIPFWLKSTEVT